MKVLLKLEEEVRVMLKSVIYQFLVHMLEYLRKRIIFICKIYKVNSVVYAKQIINLYIKTKKMNQEKSKLEEPFLQSICQTNNKIRNNLLKINNNSADMFC